MFSGIPAHAHIFAGFSVRFPDFLTCGIAHFILSSVGGGCKGGMGAFASIALSTDISSTVSKISKLWKEEQRGSQGAQ